jgi:hypothetical protein
LKSFFYIFFILFLTFFFFYVSLFFLSFGFRVVFILSRAGREAAARLSPEGVARGNRRRRSRRGGFPCRPRSGRLPLSLALPLLGMVNHPRLSTRKGGAAR